MNKTLCGLFTFSISIFLQASQIQQPYTLRGLNKEPAVLVDDAMSLQEAMRLCDNVRDQLDGKVRQGALDEQLMDHLSRNMPDEVAKTLDVLKNPNRKDAWPRVVVFSAQSGKGKSMWLHFFAEYLQRPHAILNATNFLGEYLDAGSQKVKCVFKLLNERAANGPLFLGIEAINLFAEIDRVEHHLDKNITRTLWKNLQTMSENIVVMGTTLSEGEYVRTMLPVIRMNVITLRNEQNLQRRLATIQFALARMKIPHNCSTAALSTIASNRELTLSDIGAIVHSTFASAYHRDGTSPIMQDSDLQKAYESHYKLLANLQELNG